MPKYGTTWFLRISTDPASWVRDDNKGEAKAAVIHYWEEDDPALQKDLKTAEPLTATPAIDRGTLMAIGFVLMEKMDKANMDNRDAAYKEWPLILDPVDGVKKSILDFINSASDDYNHSFVHGLYAEQPRKRKEVAQDAERVIKDRLGKEFMPKLEAQLRKIK